MKLGHIQTKQQLTDSQLSVCHPDIYDKLYGEREREALWS